MRKLSRTTLGQISDAWNSGALGAKPTTKTTKKVPKLIAKNTTNATLKTGATVAITGFSATLSRDDAREKMLNNELILSIAAPTSGTPTETLATTTETIVSGGIGTIDASIIFAAVHFNATTDIYSTSTGTSQEDADGAAFRIVAKSSLNSRNDAICALSRLGGGGGGVASIGVVDTVEIRGSLQNVYYNLTNGITVFDPLAPNTYNLAAGDSLVYLPCSGSGYSGVVIQGEALS